MVLFNVLNIKTCLSPRTAQLSAEACGKEALITQLARGAEMAALGGTDVVGLCHMEVRTEGHAILHGDTSPVLPFATKCLKISGPSIPTKKRWSRHMRMSLRE